MSRDEPWPVVRTPKDARGAYRTLTLSPDRARMNHDLLVEDIRATEQRLHQLNRLLDQNDELLRGAG